MYYHISQPSREVEAIDDPEVSNAVSQALAFSALAICSTQKSNDTRVAAAGACQTWKVGFNLMPHKVAALEEEVQGSSTTGRSEKKNTAAFQAIPSGRQDRSQRKRSGQMQAPGTKHQTVCCDLMTERAVLTRMLVECAVLARGVQEVQHRALVRAK